MDPTKIIVRTVLCHRPLTQFIRALRSHSRLLLSLLTIRTTRCFSIAEELRIADNFKMATACKLIRGSLIKKGNNTIRCLSNASGKQYNGRSSSAMAYAIGGTLALYAVYKIQHPQKVHAIQVKSVSYLRYFLYQ